MELHPLIRQAYHEHAEGHIARMRDRLDAARPQPGIDPASMGAGASQGAPAPTAGNATAGAAATAQPASDGGGTPPFAPVQMSFAEGAFRVDNTSKETLKGFSDRLIQAVEAINVGPGQIHVNPTPVTVKPNITVEPSPVEVRERPPLHVRLTGVERDKQGRITGADFKASEDSSPPASKG